MSHFISRLGKRSICKVAFLFEEGKLKYEFYRNDIEQFTNEENMFFYSKSSEEYEHRKYIMKLFLEVAFELMSKKEKEVYKLRNEENLNHEEISKELGISVVNSRKILYKANQKVMRIANLIEKIKFIEKQERT